MEWIHTQVIRLASIETFQISKVQASREEDEENLPTPPIAQPMGKAKREVVQYLMPFLQSQKKK
jgi:hypothetical protein